jgi:ribonuclease Z
LANTIIFATMLLTILGSSGALPAYGRYPTCQVLDVGADMFLIDCGEGAQIQMQQYKIRSNRINHVFISHLHGDHYFGLIGWLNSQSLFKRTKPLHIYAPAKLLAIINLQLEYTLSFIIEFHALQEGQAYTLFENEKYQVFCFPVEHSVPTHGFRFTVKRPNNIINKAAITQYEIPIYYLQKLTMGNDYIKQDGTIIPNHVLTFPKKPDLVYCYTADTLYTESILPYISHCNLLYHEATYTEEHSQLATDRQHSTAKQAATIAKLGMVQQLLIGHYSSKYKNTQQHLAEALTVFEQTTCVHEGYTIEIK